MNLHILPDSKFSNTFIRNLDEAGLLEDNRIIVRSNKKQLTYIQASAPFAPLYSSRFSEVMGHTGSYNKVFIHQFSPLMYRWVANHSFKELNWMVWGTDLYNLPFVKEDFYERETRAFGKAHWSLNDFLYRVKVYVTNMPFRKKAYARVDHVLTWMRSEFEFAKRVIPELKASHRFFFYENQLPYEALDNISPGYKPPGERMKIILGNSGTPTNNHLDAIRKIADSGIEADLYIPLSYGDQSYIRFLKRNLPHFPNGKITLLENFMEFDEYIRFLTDADALVMNHIRPQGYGNIFMMMYLNKPVYLNEENLSLGDLRSAGLQFQSLADLTSSGLHQVDTNNREKIMSLLSHDRLLETYRQLFK